MAIPSDSPIKIAILDEDLGNRPGLPNKVAVRATVINSGWGFEQKIAANELNELLNNHGEWLEYVEEQVPQNKSDISGLDSRVTTNEGNISTNTSNISTNTSNISTNTSNISTNTSDIAVLTARVDQLEIDVSGLQLPVGTILEFNVSGNPSGLLGYGTWVAFAAGRVTVGLGATTDDNGDTINFNVNGAEGGVFSHEHTVSRDGWGNTGSPLPSPSTADRLVVGNGATETGETLESVSHAANDRESENTNSQNPYIVVYKWVRTA